jgi:hypothetical protein
MKMKAISIEIGGYLPIEHIAKRQAVGVSIILIIKGGMQNECKN